MKFTLATVLASAVLALAVTAQNSTTEPAGCTTCLQNSLLALPDCKGLNITIGSMTSGVTPQYAACLCSSLNGAWIGTCTSACGPDIAQLEATYAQSLQESGLNCNGTTPTFNPPTDLPVPPSTLPTGTQPAGSSPSPTTGGAGGSSSPSSGKGSAGVASSLPWATEVIGVLTVMAAVGASFL